jgi:hypothetical protein
MASIMFNWMAQMAGMGGMMSMDPAAAAAGGGLAGMQGGHMSAAAARGWGLPMEMGDEGLDEQDDDEDNGVPPGEGAADGSQVQRLVDMGNYDDGYKWRK